MKNKKLLKKIKRIVRVLLAEKEPSPKGEYKVIRKVLDLSKAVSLVRIDFIEFTDLYKVEVDIITEGYPENELKKWNVVIEGGSSNFPNIIEISPCELTILYSDRRIQGKVYVTDTSWDSEESRFRILLAGDGALVDDTTTKTK